MNPVQGTVGDVNDTNERRCLACGYNLHGLGEQPRCPECGLLNIPEGYRRQVWELVDSGRWFFSGFLRPLRKRPPGWWWALDRKDDVRRALRFAATHLSITAALIMAFSFLANAVAVEFTTNVRSFHRDDRDPVTGEWRRLTRQLVEELNINPIAETNDVRFLGIGLLSRWDGQRAAHPWMSGPACIQLWRESSRLVFSPSWHFVPFTIAMLLWIGLVWAAPALAGLYTQVRKGLPEFARPARTVLAAAGYETHRCTYLALAFGLAMGVEVAVRQTWQYGNMAWLVKYALICGTLSAALLLFGTVGWIGPLRSDYTRQLVRSRWHAMRIIIMYAVLLPWAFVFAGPVLLFLMP